MPFDLKKTIGFAAIILAAFTIVFYLSSYIEKNKRSLPAGYEDSDLAFQGKRLKGYAFGAEGLLADWYWILSLQYIGNKIVASDAETLNVEDLTSLNPRLLYPYLDNATDLDPKFFAAYSYGAIVLPAIDPAKAIALTEKGIANNPDKWRLYQYLGYIYWRLNNFEKAVEVYNQGSAVPGAPPFMRQMAAAMTTRGGSRDIARGMYTQMLAESEDQQSKENARVRLLQLDALDELDALNAAVKSFRDRTGRCPGNFTEIFPLLRSVQLPGGKDFRTNAVGNIVVDPSGAPYFFNTRSCTIEIDPKTSKIPRQ
jgi:tetratricopeptide (TPR) repeat protein